MTSGTCSCATVEPGDRRSRPADDDDTGARVPAGEHRVREARRGVSGSHDQRPRSEVAAGRTRPGGVRSSDRRRQTGRRTQCSSNCLRRRRACSKPAGQRGPRRTRRGPLVCRAGDPLPRTRWTDRSKVRPGRCRCAYSPPGARGVLLHIHGGGWRWAPTTSGPAARGPVHDCADRCRRRRISTAPEHPYPPQTTTARRRPVAGAERPPEFGTERLFIGGESAGAHLSVVTMLRLR